VLEEADDACFTHSIGDHEARATAVKVSVGGDPSQPWLPQHSQACVFGFHWMKVWPSSAGWNRKRIRLVGCFSSPGRQAGNTHCRMCDRPHRRTFRPYSRRRNSCCRPGRSNLGRIASSPGSRVALHLRLLGCCCRDTSPRERGSGCRSARSSSEP